MTSVGIFRHSELARKRRRKRGCRYASSDSKIMEWIWLSSYFLTNFVDGCPFSGLSTFYNEATEISGEFKLMIRLHWVFEFVQPTLPQSVSLQLSCFQGKSISSVFPFIVFIFHFFPIFRVHRLRYTTAISCHANHAFESVRRYTCITALGKKIRGRTSSLRQTFPIGASISDERLNMSAVLGGAAVVLKFNAPALIHRRGMLIYPLKWGTHIPSKENDGAMTGSLRNNDISLQMADCFKASIYSDVSLRQSCAETICFSQKSSPEHIAEVRS